MEGESDKRSNTIGVVIENKITLRPSVPTAPEQYSEKTIHKGSS